MIFPNNNRRKNFSYYGSPTKSSTLGIAAGIFIVIPVLIVLLVLLIK
jgi:hypothetical protein